MFIFVLCRSHWTLLHCQLQDVTAVVTQYDGLACTSLECLEALCHQIKVQWGVTTHQLTTTWLISQTQPDSCGTIALGHFAILLGKISTDQARDFEKIHPSLARCSEFRYSPDLIGLGNAEEEIVAGLTDILLPAWAVVLDGYGTLSCGHLQGIQQCILRAEITAVISAIQWCKYEEGDLHLWVDNLTVVEHVRDLQRKAAVPDDFDHSDLWHIIAGVLQTSRANIWIHKAKGHDEEELCENPLEDFCRVGNDKADQQAVLTNSRRPPFFERVWERYIQFRRVWKRRVAQLTAYQVAIAQAEITDENTFEDDQFQDSVSHFDFEKFPNSAEVSVQLSTLSEGDMPFSNSHDAVFRQHAVQIFRWIISEDQQASFMRQVSLLEMYVCYRCSLAGKRPLLELGQSVTLFAVVSFASDFSYFKKVYRFICKWSKLDWVTGSVDLSLVRILNPPPARCLGWRNDNVSLALLSDFVGRRPVTSAQALARPWQP